VNAEAGDTFDVNIDRLSGRSLTLTGAATAKIVGADLMLDELTNGDLSFGSAASVDEAEFAIEVSSVTVSGSTYAATFNITGSGSTLGGNFSVDTTDSVTGVGPTSGDVLTIAPTTDSGLSSDLEINVENLAGDIQEGDKFFVSVDEFQLNARDAQVAESALGIIDDAIAGVSSAVSNLGDSQNRLNFKLDNLKTAKINNEAARSQIEDADFAFQQVQLAKQQILQQSGTSALAQANAAPQSVLSLFGG
jgi:flagellin-like hook-associated protein FlgL